MRESVRWYLLVFAVFMAVSSRGAAGEGTAINQAWLAKTRTEVKSVYDKYQALSMRIEAEYEIRSDKTPGSTGTIPFYPQTRRERSIRLGDNIILEQIRNLDGKDGKPNIQQIQLECDNNDYHFTLIKSKENSPYAMKDYALGKRKLPLSKRSAGLQDTVFSYFRHILGAVEDDGEYTLRALQFDDAKGLLRIECKFGTGATFAEEQIFVDPSHGWRVIERRVETPYASGTDRWTYGVTVGGLEFPNEFKNLTTYKVDKAPPNQDITGRLISLKVTDKTPDDFRLSAFGFSEPVDAPPPPPRPTRWYLWLLAAAGVCAALSFGFAYLRRRRLARNASTSLQGERL
jgi:hypothetical protein